MIKSTKHMRFWFDTEFIDNTHTIELISIGIVSENGRTYYAISNEFDGSKADEWVKQHVLTLLPPQSEWKSRAQIKEDILIFIGNMHPEFWVYNGAYDWVAFCQLFGHIRDLPKGYPWYSNDIKQLWHMLGKPVLPEQKNAAHHALHDAEWNKTAWNHLTSVWKERFSLELI